MKKVSKTLAIVLCLAMILSLTAFAAWTTYQGDIAHTGKISDSAPPITSSATVTPITLPYSGSGWSGVDSEPVMHKEGDVTYAYVLYNGHANYGGTIAKVNCNTGSLVWYIPQATPTAANQLSTPLLVGNTLYYVYNNETTAASGSNSTRQYSSSSLTITANLTDADASYRLYLPSTIYSGSSVTMAVKVTKPDGTSVYLNMDNDDPAETGSPTTRTLTTSSTTSALNKNFASVFAAAGTYTIKVEYTLSSGSYKMGSCYLYQNHVTLGKIDDVTDGNPPDIDQVVTDLPGSGQMNTPITTDGKYIYFGTWLSGTANGKYYQIDIRSGSTYGDYKSILAGTGYGFYWAGAAPVDTNNDETYDYVVFGGDGGYLYYRSISDFEGTGGVYDLSNIATDPDDNVTAGNVRSTISSDGTYIYFTSQGPTGTSYLWRFLISTIGSSTPTYSVLALDGGSSTSTPAISANGMIYVGYYNGFSSGGVDVIDQSTFARVANISGLDAIQSSIAVYTSVNNDYFFFTTNAAAGAGYCYRIDTTDLTDYEEIWNTTNYGTGYALQGMAASNGYLTFGNESEKFFIIH